MGLLRSAALRSALFRSAARPGIALRKSVSQPCLRLGHETAARGYSSSGKPFKKSSDLPWAVVAVAGTGVGLYIALSPSDPDAAHGDHGDHHKKSEHSEEDGEKDASADDGSDDKTSGEEPQAEGKNEDSKQDSKDDSKDQDEGEGAKSDNDSKDEEGGDSQSNSGSGNETLHKGMTKNTEDTKKREADPGKGATKVRIDSAAGKTIGEGASSGEGDQFAQKQKGVSNTDTKHSTDPHKDAGKSSKGEGTAETAKIKGTVQLDRPQV